MTCTNVRWIHFGHVPSSFLPGISDKYSSLPLMEELLPSDIGNCRTTSINCPDTTAYSRSMPMQWKSTVIDLRQGRSAIFHSSLSIHLSQLPAETPCPNQQTTRPLRGRAIWHHCIVPALAVQPLLVPMALEYSRSRLDEARSKSDLVNRYK